MIGIKKQTGYYNNLANKLNAHQIGMRAITLDRQIKKAMKLMPYHAAMFFAFCGGKVPSYKKNWEEAFELAQSIMNNKIQKYLNL